jgi:type IV pilus assembly protein PilB
VFTTVHANNVIDVIGRFLNMGVEPYNFVSSLNCILAQRLVRTICLFCKRPHKAEAALLEESGLDPARYAGHTFFRGEGCIQCSGTGYKGRSAISELLDLSDEIREMLIEDGPPDIKTAKSARLSRARGRADLTGQTAQRSTDDVRGTSPRRNRLCAVVDRPPGLESIPPDEDVAGAVFR